MLFSQAFVITTLLVIHLPHVIVSHLNGTFSGSPIANPSTHVFALGQIHGFMLLVVGTMPYHKNQQWLYNITGSALDETNGLLLLKGTNSPVLFTDRWPAFRKSIFYEFWSKNGLVYKPKFNMYFLGNFTSLPDNGLLLINYEYTDAPMPYEMTMLNISYPNLPLLEAGSYNNINETYFTSSEANVLYAIGRAEPRIIRYIAIWDQTSDFPYPVMVSPTSGLYWVCRNSTKENDNIIFLSAHVCPVVAVDWNVFSGFVSSKRFYVFTTDQKVHIFNRSLFGGHQSSGQCLTKTFGEFFWDIRPPPSTYVTTKSPSGVFKTTFFAVAAIFVVSLILLVLYCSHRFCGKAAAPEPVASSKSKAADASNSQPKQSVSAPEKPSSPKLKVASPTKQSTNEKKVASPTKRSDNEKKLPKVASPTKQSAKEKKLLKKAQKEKSKKTKKLKLKLSKKSKKKSKNKSKKDKSTSKGKDDSEHESKSAVPMETGAAKKVPFRAFPSASGKGPLSNAGQGPQNDKSRKMKAKTKLNARSTGNSNAQTDGFTSKAASAPKSTKKKKKSIKTKAESSKKKKTNAKKQKGKSASMKNRKSKKSKSSKKK